jgi:hypothetical protein
VRQKSAKMVKIYIFILSLPFLLKLGANAYLVGDGFISGVLKYQKS